MKTISGTLHIEERLPKSKLLARCECGESRICYVGNWNRGDYSACKTCTSKKQGIRCYERFSKGRTGLENRLIGAYASRAKRRGLCFELTRDVFLALTQRKCHYCHFLPSNKASGVVRKTRKTNAKDDFTYNGIDRIDSKKGYITENCVPCCTKCNRAKYTMKYDEFLSFIERFRQGGISSSSD